MESHSSGSRILDVRRIGAALALCLLSLVSYAQSGYREAYFGAYNLTLNVPSELLTRGGDRDGEILFQHRFEGQGRQPMMLELLASTTGENQRMVRGKLPDYLRERGEVVHYQKVKLANTKGWYLKYQSVIGGQPSALEAFLIRRKGRVFVLSLSGPSSGLGIEESKMLREMAESVRFW